MYVILKQFTKLYFHYGIPLSTLWGWRHVTIMHFICVGIKPLDCNPRTRNSWKMSTVYLRVSAYVFGVNAPVLVRVCACDVDILQWQVLKTDQDLKMRDPTAATTTTTTTTATATATATTTTTTTRTTTRTQKKTKKNKNCCHHHSYPDGYPQNISLPGAFKKKSGEFHSPGQYGYLDNQSIGPPKHILGEPWPSWQLTARPWK